MTYAFLTTLLVLAVYVWQDGLMGSNDGTRYTSGKPQPYPFHRRFCGWNEQVLIFVTLGSLLALGTLAGTWKGALLLMTLPGAWVLATHPTTVDAPAALLAWVGALLFPKWPWFGVLLSCVSGFIHERGPVYAAIYAWHPLPLIGLVACGWWRQPAPADDDVRVGRGFIASFANHRQDHDWLGPQQTLLAARGLPLLAVFFGVTPAAWAALGLAWAQRFICTDLGRLVFWAGPIIVRDLPDVPAWMVLAQAMTFRRMA